jgi:hypothetical protein
VTLRFLFIVRYLLLSYLLTAAFPVSARALRCQDVFSSLSKEINGLHDEKTANPGHFGRLLGFGKNKLGAKATEVAKAFVYDIDKLLDYPRISRELTVSDLEKLSVGIYRLESPPSLKLFQTLVAWGTRPNGDIWEAGLRSYRGIWILTITHEPIVKAPADLTVLSYERLVSFDFHTHPSIKEWSHLPSFSDFNMILGTFNQTFYIGSPKGLSVIHSKWGRDIKYEFIDWAEKKGRSLKDPSYLNREWAKDFSDYLIERGILKLIPWSESAAIAALLKEGEYDPLTDPSFSHFPSHLTKLLNQHPTVEIGPLKILDDIIDE